MNKLVVAVALAACSVAPSKAAIYFELIGAARVDNYNSLQQFFRTDFYNFRLAGNCESGFVSQGSISCSIRNLDGAGFFFQFSEQYPSYFDYVIGAMSWRFAPTVTDPFDGIFHSGGGGGSAQISTGRYSFQWVYFIPLFALVMDVPSIGASIPDIHLTAPEPAGWAMMVGGFALAGAGLRRRNTPRLTFVNRQRI